MLKRTILGSTALVCLVIAGSARAQTYHQVNLISDGSVPALKTDPNMKDPWGLSFSTGSPFWISDQASSFTNPGPGGITSGVATLGSVSGPPNNPTVTIPGLIVNTPNAGGAPVNPTINGPTGQVSTGAAGITTIASDFPVVGPNGGAAHKASFIFANLDGSISAWAGGSSGTPIPNTTATLQPTATVAGATFTGLAIANNPAAAIGGASGVQLYAADQNSANVNVFNSQFQKIGTFTDPTLPVGYTAFNVQNIGGTLYVLFSNPANPLGGIVDKFAPDGTMLGRLITDTGGTNLMQPWGITLAPSTFGTLGGDLLIGNNAGNNWINAYNPTTGAFIAPLIVDGHPFSEGNLWALTFGNGGAGGDANTLYFSAGITDVTEGLFGSIAVPEPSPLLLAGAACAVALGVRLVRRRLNRPATSVAAA
jgi:uncharacterized protein (TIGR03118 family)